jgi:2,4-dienoyl-CoA reductase-like NADH-dependent reductase (Old Yellow Enzyme family)
MSGPTTLLSPLVLDGVRIANRLGLGPINPGFFEEDGSASDAVRNFYADFVHGGIGLVYIGGVAVSLDGRSNAASLVADRCSAVHGIADIASIVHGSGSVLAVQLMHAGRQASSLELGSELLAASSIPCRVYRERPQEASVAHIRRLVEQFQSAAGLVQDAGADIVEIHAAHGYLLSGFLSANSNRRSDAYGGSTLNRFRILRQVLEAVRSAVDCPVGVRVNVAENVSEDALGIEELLGGLDSIRDYLSFVSVTAGVYTTGEDWIIPRRALGPALWQRQAGIIRRALGVPVMLAGNISTPELANGVIIDGDADLALMVRALLADPSLLAKWSEDRRGDIQPCTELMLCKYHSRGRRNVYCPFNRVLHSQFHPRRPRGVQLDVLQGRILGERREEREEAG